MKKALKQPYKQFLGTLANQVRLEIIEHLLQGKSNVSGVVECLDYDQSTISHSIKRLEECGFVTVEKNGNERIYTLNKATIKPLFKLMHAHMNTYCKHVVQKTEERCH